VEKAAKPGSMVWKIFQNLVPWCGKSAETGFHGVEDFAGGGLSRGGRKSTGTKVGSMPWKFFRKWVPWRGKLAQFGFHAVEKRRI
jgi:hypothetical protein